MTWKRIIKYDTNQDFVEAMSEEAQKALEAVESKMGANIPQKPKRRSPRVIE